MRLTGLALLLITCLAATAQRPIGIWPLYHNSLEISYPATDCDFEPTLLQAEDLKNLVLPMDIEGKVWIKLRDDMAPQNLMEKAFFAADTAYQSFTYIAWPPTYDESRTSYCRNGSIVNVGGLATLHAIVEDYQDSLDFLISHAFYPLSDNRWYYYAYQDGYPLEMLLQFDTSPLKNSEGSLTIWRNDKATAVFNYTSSTNADGDLQIEFTWDRFLKDMNQTSVPGDTPYPLGDMIVFKGSNLGQLQLPGISAMYLETPY